LISNRPDDESGESQERSDWGKNLVGKTNFEPNEWNRNQLTFKDFRRKRDNSETYLRHKIHNNNNHGKKLRVHTNNKLNKGKNAMWDYMHRKRRQLEHVSLLYTLL